MEPARTARTARVWTARTKKGAAVPGRAAALGHGSRGRRERPGWQTPAPAGRRRALAAAARATLAVTVWTTTTAGLGVVVTQSAEAASKPGPARVEDAVALVSGGAALAGAWWLAFATAASVVAALLAARRPDAALTRVATRVARRAAPASLRRAAALALGLSLGGIAAPALATPRPPAVAAAPVASVAAGEVGSLDPVWGGATPSGARQACDPAWVPAVPAAPPVRTAAAARVTMPGPAPRARQAARSEVVVRRGDTLWSIVERHLGRHASAAEVAAEWPRWHAANRAVLGPDPDVLLPGQRLRPPDPAPRLRAPSTLPQTSGGHR